MTNKEAIEILRNIHVYDVYPQSASEEIKQTLDLAIKALEQSEWIPVSKKLPKRNGVYSVTRMVDETAIIDACYFDGQNTWHSDNRVNHGRPYLNDVTAWIPRPEPYKEEDND